ncbi:MAG: MAPEG family protein [Pseudomonadota bacterium]
MTERTRVLLGMIAGLLWSVGLLVGAALFLNIPVFALVPTIMTAFLAPGLILAVIIGWASMRGFAKAPSQPGEVDRRVIQNTVEQLALAAAIWPAAAVLLGPAGPGVIMGLGVGFAVARMVYWAGCHCGAGRRAFGFAATFFPTVLAALWALVTVIF